MPTWFAKEGDEAGDKPKFHRSNCFHPVAVADPGGAPPAHAPPTGPDSFVLTYKFFET